jgi:hypothetical protein
MKKLVTVAIPGEGDKFDYYESEENFWTTFKALWAIWKNGYGSINISKDE